jgi:hypothetical protein
MQFTTTAAFTITTTNDWTGLFNTANLLSTTSTTTFQSTNGPLVLSSVNSLGTIASSVNDVLVSATTITANSPLTATGANIEISSSSKSVQILANSKDATTDNKITIKSASTLDVLGQTALSIDGGSISASSTGNNAFNVLASTDLSLIAADDLEFVTGADATFQAANTITITSAEYVL